MMAERNAQTTPDLREFLIAINAINGKSYSLPSVSNLTSVPHYRKLNRANMGSSDKLCSVAALLYRMRQQDASWSEMHFLYLEVGDDSRSVVVVSDGCIVDGLAHSSPVVHNEDDAGETLEEDVIEQAFWEGLSEDLAGLMAVHHFEDVVLVDRRSSDEARRGDGVIERLGDLYQFYLFPHAESEPEGFEAAIGAAIIADGLYHRGLASEVVQHLQLGQP
jgi:predicted butyrate kinase (DUF1464 family)